MCYLLGSLTDKAFNQRLILLCSWSPEKGCTCISSAELGSWKYWKKSICIETNQVKLMWPSTALCEGVCVFPDGGVCLSTFHTACLFCMIHMLSVLHRGFHWCLCCQHFFPEHLERWRWQVFMGAAARWNTSNCCLLLLFCAAGIWRQHLLYESWGWVLCCPACSASTLLSVHPDRCPVAFLCYPQSYGGDVSCVQHWVSERWLSRHSFCFARYFERYFITFLDSPVNAVHSSEFCWLP